MRAGTVFALTSATILAGSLAACDDFKVNNPAQPTDFPGGLELHGPETIEPSGSGQFTAMLRASDGTLKPLAGVQWFTSDPAILLVNPAGVATGRNRAGDATISASVTGPSRRSLSVSREVIVVPNGTFRVAGLVTDAEFPVFGVAGARVEVSPTLFAITNTSGRYQLYGVPPEAQVTITGSGYHPLTDNLSLTGHTTRNYSMAPSAPRIALSGDYTLAVDALGSCIGGGMTPDLQHRRYDARVTPRVLDLTVTLTEPRFVLNSAGKGNQFLGTLNVSSAAFSLDPWDYYSAHPSVAERLPDGSVLVIYGQATTTASAGGVSGPLNGGMTRWDSRFPNFGFSLGNCSTQVQFSLTPR